MMEEDIATTSGTRQGGLFAVVYNDPGDLRLRFRLTDGDFSCASVCTADIPTEKTFPELSLGSPNPARHR